MDESLIKIVDFCDKFQADIDAFMNKITNEFAESISHSDPKTKKISELVKLPTEKYWVAVSNEKAIGTIGLCMIASDKIVLKRMFISTEFRRKGVGQLLLNALLAWAEENKKKAVYLGTMNQFHAAHQFYENNGFTKIEKSFLPEDFPINPVDRLFYYKFLIENNIA